METTMATGSSVSAQTRKLTYRWLTDSEALEAAIRGAIEMEAMRQGVGLLSQEQFQQGLANKEIEVLLLPHNCACLVSFGECEQGKVLNVLTVTGDLRYASEGIIAIEQAALQRGANVVMSVGHMGWYKFAQIHGYNVKKVMLMRKDLRHANTLS